MNLRLQQLYKGIEISCKSIIFIENEVVAALKISTFLNIQLPNKICKKHMKKDFLPNANVIFTNKPT